MRVWVTRDEASPPEGALGAALQREGLTPVHGPVVRRRRLGDARESIAPLDADDWLVLTSAFAVECAAAQPSRTPRVAAVGPATAAAARQRGFRVELVGRDDVASLVGQLRPLAERRRICHPRSSLTEPIAFRADAIIDSPIVYEIEPQRFDRTVIERVDIAAICSPSAIRVIGHVELPLASIGPATTRAMRDLGMEARVLADEPTFHSLAKAIAAYADSSRRQRA